MAFYLNSETGFMCINFDLHRIEKSDSNVTFNPLSQVRRVFAEMYDIDLSQIAFRPFVAHIISLRGRVSIFAPPNFQSRGQSNSCSIREALGPCKISFL